MLTRRKIATRMTARSYNNATRTCKNLLILKNVISESEEATIIKFLNTILVRKKYEGNHWDDVIQQYKEIELSNYKVPQDVNDVVQRLQKLIQDIIVKPVSFLPPHVIDLSHDGFIGPHVDSIKFSGGFVAGLSLESMRIMALSISAESESAVNMNRAGQISGKQVPHTSPVLSSTSMSLHATNYKVDDQGLSFEEISCCEGSSCSDGSPLVRQAPYPGQEREDESLPALIELPVPPRSLYLLMGAWRFNYNHAILGVNQQPVLVSPLSEPISRRTSIIFRDVKS